MCCRLRSSPTNLPQKITAGNRSLPRRWKQARRG
jgi:hypothetical protein